MTSGLVCHNLRAAWISRPGIPYSGPRPGHGKVQLTLEPRYASLLFGNVEDQFFFCEYLAVVEQGESMPVSELMTLAPQVAHEQLAVREICCAIGAQVVAATRSQHTEESLSKMQASHSHYSRAIAAIRKFKVVPENILTATFASILFTAWELVNDSLDAAVLHYRHAYMLMGQSIRLKCDATGLEPDQLNFTPLEAALLDMVQGVSSLSWARGMSVKLPPGAINIKNLRRKGYAIDDMPQKFHHVQEATSWWNTTKFFVRDGLQSQRRARKAGRSNSPVLPPRADGIDNEGCGSPNYGKYIVVLRRWYASFEPLMEDLRKKKHQAASQFLQATTLNTLYLETLTRVHRVAYPDRHVVLPSTTPLYIDIIHTVSWLSRTLTFTGPGGSKAQHSVVRPLSFVMRYCQDAAVLKEMEGILWGMTDRCPMALNVFVLLTCDRKNLDILPPILRGSIRALDWYLASCGCEVEEID